jgi:hypothetical protein
VNGRFIVLEQRRQPIERAAHRKLPIHCRHTYETRMHLIGSTGNPCPSV